MTLPGQRQRSRRAPAGNQRRGRSRTGGHLRVLTGGGSASGGTESAEERLAEGGLGDLSAGPPELVAHAAGAPDVDREVLAVTVHRPADSPDPEPLPEPWPELRRVTRTVLGRDEWALTLLPGGVRLVTDVIHSVERYSQRSAPGSKVAFVRVPAEALNPRLGP